MTSMIIYVSFIGALRAIGSSYFGSGDLPTIMAYTDCYGTENELSNCYGFRYTPPYIPHWYCSDNTVAGVECLGKTFLRMQVDGLCKCEC